MSQYFSGLRKHATKKGPPERYPWDAIAAGQPYFLKVGQVRQGTAYAACWARNRKMAELGRPERFQCPNVRVAHPMTGEACWVVRRVE